MRITCNELEQDIFDIISICQNAISGKSKDPLHESNLAQIQNVIVPEMESLLAAIKTNNIKRFVGKRLNSAWYVMDTWDFNSVLGDKIITLNNNLNKR